jgi:uncharacterized protein (TIGR00730 family)
MLALWDAHVQMVVPRVFQRVCVFCGSSSGNRPIYAEAAAELGHELARQGIELVYGGGHVGLMGSLADGALSARGRVIGVMPKSMIEREIGHAGITEMHIVGSMHERKARMAELADAFIALPGGYGTLDEFCEILTWAQLGIHAKPCGILNCGEYFQFLLQMFDHAVREGLLNRIYRDMILVDDNPRQLLERLREAPMGPVAKQMVPVSRAPVP